MILLKWILFYLIPALAAYLLKLRFQKPTRISYIHILILISAIVLRLSGIKLIWNLSADLIVLIFLSIIFAIVLNKRLGFFYSLSSFMQQWCLLLSGTILIPETGLVIASTLTAIPFVFTHQMEQNKCHWKFFLLLFWGFFSIYLYFILEQPLLNISLHIIFGNILIKKELLYKNQLQI